MTARAALRAGTREEHERVDRLFGPLDLASSRDYRRFLAAQAAAFLPVEAALEEAGVAAVLEDPFDRVRPPDHRQAISKPVDGSRGEQLAQRAPDQPLRRAVFGCFEAGGRRVLECSAT